MKADHSLPLRRAIVATLKLDSGVAALVGSRVYEQASAKPTWPFIRYEAPVVASFEASCWDGSEHQPTLHCFAKGKDMQRVAELASAVTAALDVDVLPLAAGIKLVDLDWVETQYFRDPQEAEGHHAIVRFTARTAVQS